MPIPTALATTVGIIPTAESHLEGTLDQIDAISLPQNPTDATPNALPVDLYSWNNLASTTQTNIATPATVQDTFLEPAVS